MILGKTLERINGLLNWISQVIPSVKGSFARLLARGQAAGSVRPRPKPSAVALDDNLREELKTVESCLRAFNGASRLDRDRLPELRHMPAADARLDGELQGVGVFWQGLHRFYDPRDFRDDWRTIAELETLAILLTLVHFGRFWFDRTVRLLCDSQNAQAVVRKGFSAGVATGRRLSSLARAIRVTETFLRINLRMVDIRSEYNVFADAVSRSETEATKRFISEWLRDNIPEGVPASPIPGVPTRAKGKLRQFLVELGQCLVSGHPSVRLVDLACSV